METILKCTKYNHSKMNNTICDLEINHNEQSRIYQLCRKLH